MVQSDVLIVGGGHAGAQCAISLRQQGYNGTITIATDENELPYERPPLSKEYLSGEKAFERLLIRPAQFWAERAITMLTGTRVVAVDPAAHRVTTGQGATIAYRTLVWATGGSPRRLICAGHDLKGVHAVRNRADVDRLLAELPAVRQIVVIGGGYIGLEAAAVLTKFGKSVTVVEALDRVLARVAGEPLSRFYEHEHRAHGVEMRLNEAVDCILGKDGRVVGVQLRDGEIIPADLVVVGIGIVPAVQPLIEGGASGGNGVDVDEHCHTSLVDVFAIGDCAAHENRYAGGQRIRLESVQNANDQALVAAHAIMGVPRAYDAVPWFWSNQYDLRLQTIGLSSGHDATVVRGDPATRSFSIVYLKDSAVIALDCVNATRDFVQGKALVVGRLRVPPAQLGHAGLPLKEAAAGLMEQVSS